MPDADTTLDDGRKIRRQKVLKQGKILLLNGLSSFDCTVRDLSATGAKLLCSDTTAIPDAFRLANPADRTMRDVKVMWRKAGQLGVQFTSEPRKSPLLKW